MDKLATPRNLAAHEGESPDREVAADAIRTARDLVSISPLPSAESLTVPTGASRNV
jgi:hypothetical protein